MSTALFGTLARGAQLTVSWDDNSTNESGFKVERSTDGSTFASVATLGANIKSYTDATLSASTTYWYRVRAYNATTTSSYSNVTSGTTAAGTGTGGGTGTGTTQGRIKTFTARAVASRVSPQPITVDFTITGGTKALLLRGTGPALRAFTGSKTLTDPELQVYSGSTLVASNNNWVSSSALLATTSRVGAYALSAGSKDAALSTSLSAKAYREVVSGNYSGLAQAEIYDADTATTPAGRFTKIMAKATVGTGSGILVGGIVVSGNTSVKLLIRAIGPSLTGVSGVLANPVLSVYRGSTLVQQNDNWGGSSTLSSAFATAGASSLSGSSKDSAMIVTLAPGVYSATVVGTSNTVGVGRLEVYELPL